MYEKGDLKLTVLDQYRDEDAIGDRSADEEGASVSDARGTDGQGFNIPVGTAYLPHSCDQWVIGGPEQVRQMIADLQDALGKIEAGI